MAFSYSRRKMGRQCLAKYERYYLVKPRPPYRPGDKQVVGNEADDILEQLINLRLAGKITSPADAVEWLKAQDGAWTSEDGIDFSLRQEALFMIEKAMRTVGHVMKLMKDADEVIPQLALGFDKKWNRLEKEEGEHPGAFVGRCRYYGVLDVFIRKGRTAYVVDWKSGQSKYRDPVQLHEYAALVFNGFDVDTVDLAFAWLAEDRFDYVEKVDRGYGLLIGDGIAAEIKSLERRKKFPPTGGFPQCWDCVLTDCPKREKR